MAGRLTRYRQAVGRFPDRRLDDIADAHLAPAAAGERDLQCPGVLVSEGGDGGQRRLDLRLQLRLGEAHRIQVFQHRLAQAVGGRDRDAVAGDDATLGQPLLLRLDAQQTALDGARARDSDRCAAQGIQQRHRRRQGVAPERQGAERLVERLAAGQADDADAATVVIDHGALQHVVDLVEAHRQRQFRLAIDLGLVLEIGEPRGRQHDAAQGQIGGSRRQGGGHGEGERRADGGNGLEHGRVVSFIAPRQLPRAPQHRLSIGQPSRVSAAISRRGHSH
ncbi:hypothetical protein STHU_31740 [Allostella humosa]|uniref:hypothetical protein n=1 Tax=Stella humosa TaxID=94 RepID=UPI001133909C|nr:hypothetical protein [Stella humosa]BBK32540.1 hypothetical protein STHU_31740 [Stella humosa]